MKFLRNLLASIFGTLIALGIIFMLFVLIASVLTESEKITVKKNSVLEIRLNAEIKDYAPKSDDPFEELLGLSSKKMGLNDIVNAIENAKSDVNIKGISLYMLGINGGIAQTQAIRGKLLDFKESGKFINAYAETKRLAEIELEKSTIPYIIFRPRALTGRGDTVIMPRLIRAFDEGKLKIIGTGKNIVDLTSVANVVDAIILGLNATSEATNEIYNISNDEPVYLWEKIDLVLKLLNKNLSPKKVPYQVVNTLAHFLEWKSILTNRKEPALTIYSAGTLAKSFTMDISKAKTLLGFKPKINTDEAIYEFINWYIENEKG